MTAFVRYDEIVTGIRVFARHCRTEEIRSMDFRITPDEFTLGCERYDGGELIQNAFPMLSDDEREFLLTGLIGDEYLEEFRMFCSTLM